MDYMNGLDLFEAINVIKIHQEEAQPQEKMPNPHLKLSLAKEKWTSIK